MQTISIPADAAGTELLAYLRTRGVAVPAPCGGHGKCGKCRVRVIRGSFRTRDGQALLPDNDGYILACRAVCTGEAALAVPDSGGDGLTAFSASSETVQPQTSPATGIALDIGTTTLAAAYVKDGRIEARVSCLNPQQSYGADVISRIEACKNGMLYAMRDCLTDAVRSLVEDLTAQTGHADTLTAAGNTTMLHIFCGVSPEGMGAYPFTPAFLDARTLPGDAFCLPVGSVTVLPSVSAFVGADITAGMHVCGLGSADAPRLLCDFGTNGEMALDTGKTRGNRLLVTSTAAGPALEGANISCGTGGVRGAVTRVCTDPDGTLVYKTIGDGAAHGICGCGLVDLIASLRASETIDETGYLEDDPYRLCGRHKTMSGTAGISETPVSLTQKDVREMQLAKSAMRAGMEALLAEAGMDPETFVRAGGKVCIAGGLGYYLDPQSAACIGLLPEPFVRDPGTVATMGNTTLAGAVEVLRAPSVLVELSALALRCETVELGDSDVFRDGFVEHMLFPEIEE